MVVAFCGHSSFCQGEEFEERVLLHLENIVGERSADIFLGGYGGFDDFALRCAKKYKQTHPNIRLIFITPYLNQSYLSKPALSAYDEILYPQIEKAPLRFAISYRNKWIAEKADVVIGYIVHTAGGAYQLYKTAEARGKRVYNIAYESTT